MKALVIAEKPSVAKDIAKVLKVPAKGDVFENNEFVISSAVGHLVSLCDPDDYDEKLKRWTLKSLPILPKKFKIKASKERGAKEQFLKLKKLMERSDVGSVVNACDAGREGELIFSYIYKLANCKKETRRLWLTSMTAGAIREGFENLREGKEMEHLRDAACCRAESDWLIGMNGTRGVSVRTGVKKPPATVGRVQTPTLSLLVQREIDIRNFVPVEFWKIVGEFKVAAGTYEGVFQKADFKKNQKNEGLGNADSADKADRIWDKATAEKIFQICKNAAAGTISEEKKHTSEACQRLYDLTTLQRDANKRFGFPATKTLQIAQRLYEHYKATTYPRTDSRALPEDYIPTCEKTLSALIIRQNLRKFAFKASENGWVRPNKRIFNNKEISDHFAIIPTDQPPSAGMLSEDEEKIYDMIARRFVAIFFPAAEFDVTTRITSVEGHDFKTEGKVLVVPGWKEVYGKDDLGNENSLPAVVPADKNSARINEIQLQNEATKPPARYTEATLLAAMESAGKFVEDEELASAMKERGLGTPATRAGIIEHLIRTKYVERAGKDLIPTNKAEQLMAFLKASKIEILTSPAMTGEWEFKLREVAEGKRSREDFMYGIAELTKSIVEKISDDGEWTETKIVSPTDGNTLLENYRMYRSRDEVLVNNRAHPKLVIYKNASGRNLSEDEIVTFLKNGKIGPFNDFKSRFGTAFKATLVLKTSPNGLIRPEFEFEKRVDLDLETFDFSTAKIVGNCPETGLPVYETPNSFRTNPADIPSNPRKTPFLMSKKLLGAEISSEQVAKILRFEKTDLIKFISNKTKKPFEASLKLRVMTSSRIAFEFAKRPEKPKATPKRRSLLKKKGAGLDGDEHLVVK